VEKVANGLKLYFTNISHAHAGQYSCLAKDGDNSTNNPSFTLSIIGKYGTQVLRYSATQVLRYSATEVLRYSATQLLRYSGTQVLMYSGTQLLRYSGTQVLRDSGTQVLRYSDTQILRYSGTQVLRYSGIQGLRTIASEFSPAAKRIFRHICQKIYISSDLVVKVIQVCGSDCNLKGQILYYTLLYPAFRLIGHMIFHAINV